MRSVLIDSMSLALSNFIDSNTDKWLLDMLLRLILLLPVVLLTLLVLLLLLTAPFLSSPSSQVIDDEDDDDIVVGAVVSGVDGEPNKLPRKWLVEDEEADEKVDELVQVDVVEVGLLLVVVRLFLR